MARIERAVAAALLMSGLVAVAPTHVAAAPPGVPATRAAGAPVAEPTPLAGTAARRAAEASASERARRSGQRIEIAALGTSRKQVYANPDGTFTLQVRAQPVRAWRGDHWVPVDTTLQLTGEETVTPKAAAADLAFSAGGHTPLARIRVGGDELSMGWPAALPAPVLSGDTATYPEVLPGVDLQVRADVEGFSEVLVVKSRAAAAQPELRRLRFTLATNGLAVRAQDGGGMVALDRSGRMVFHSPAAVMWDSSGVTGATDPIRLGAAPPAGGRVAPVGVHLSPGEVAVVPDPAMLTDPRTRFPLFIDPAWSGGKLAWTYVDRAYPEQEYWNSTHRTEAGYYGSGLKRSFFRMDSDDVIGKHILSATFRIVETYAWSCSARPIDLWLTGSISSSTNWNNQPSWGRVLDTVNTAKGYSSSCPDGGIEFDVTSAVVEGAGKGWKTTHFGLRAGNESDVYGWKGFDKNPTLVVDYNTPPAAPTGLATSPATACRTGANRPGMGSASPTLKALISDPDGTKDSVRAEFAWNYYNPASAAWEAHGSFTTSYLSSSTAVERSATMTGPGGVPLLEGGTYSWRVRAYDGTDASAWSPWCEFTVDTTPPAGIPKVASAQYPDDEPGSIDDWHDGVGRAGTFTFAPADGVTGIAGYRYALDDDNLASSVSVSAANGTAMVSLTPVHMWINNLYVWAVDGAGNVSSPRVYSFYVKPGSDPVAHWQLDETAESTAADATGSHPATLSGGTSWTAGRLAGGLRLTGTGAAETAGQVVHTDRNLSVSAWVRLNSSAATGTVLSQGGTTSGGVQLYYSASYQRWIFAKYYADSDPSQLTRAISDAAPQVGVWTHLVGTYDAASRQLRLYVNGRLQASQPTFTEPEWDATGTMQLGRVRRGAGWADYFTGDVDEVKVWDRVVVEHPMNNEIGPLATQPAVYGGWWTFDENAGTTAADSSGWRRSATLAGGAGWDVNGQRNSALLLNGSTGYASAPGPVVRTDQSFSVAAWVRLDGALPTRNATALGQDGSFGSAFYLGYRMLGGVGTWCLAVQTADTDPYTWVYAASDSLSAPRAGEWTHLVGVYDGPARKLRLYVNAQLVAEVDYADHWHGNGALQIGRVKWRNSYVDYWPGAIDDVRVYAGVLTDNDVLNLVIG